MISKPSRGDLRKKSYGLVEYFTIVFGILLIPLMSYVPQKIRIKILFWGYKLAGGNPDEL